MYNFKGERGRAWASLITCMCNPCGSILWWIYPKDLICIQWCSQDFGEGGLKYKEITARKAHGKKF